MAQFEQSAATRQAMTDAAQSYLFGVIQNSPTKGLAASLGVTERTVQRWKAFLSGSSAQSRAPNLPKVAANAPSIRVDITADYAVADDPAYLRLGKHMAWTLSQAETQQFLADALNKPDDAWQDFFDAYSLPAGTAEQARISLR